MHVYTVIKYLLLILGSFLLTFLPVRDFCLVSLNSGMFLLLLSANFVGRVGDTVAADLSAAPAVVVSGGMCQTLSG